MLAQFLPQGRATKFPLPAQSPTGKGSGAARGWPTILTVDRWIGAPSVERKEQEGSFVCVSKKALFRRGQNASEGMQ